MKEKMNKMITGVVIGLKHHLETDELVSVKTYKKIRKQSAILTLLLEAIKDVIHYTEFYFGIDIFKGAKPAELCTFNY